jgi:hypothetical protein
MSDPRFKSPVEVIAGQTRILLSEGASRHLSAQGAECFAIVAKASHPDTPARWVIHLAPCSIKTARDAEAVLFGKARATRIKKSPTVEF